MRALLALVAVALLATTLLAAPIGDFSAGRLDGWQAEGDAWGIATYPRPGYDGRHAESLAARGEPGRGVLRSDPFRITGNLITFLANGWSGRHGERGLSWFQLRRQSDGAVVRTSPPPNTDTLTTMTWPVADLAGEMVVMEAVDRDPGQAFAWLGLARVEQEEVPATTMRPLALAGRGTWGVLTFNGARTTVPPYLSSLGGGERGTGVVRSPEFAVSGPAITFELCGHDGQPPGGQQSNYACLRDVETGEVLRATYAPGNDALQPCRWETGDLAGRRVRFEICDGLAQEGYAWLGCNHVDAGPVQLHLGPGNDRWPAGWEVPEAAAGHYLTAAGIPFLALGPRATAVGEGQETRLACGFTAHRLYLLGLIGMPDHGVPCWIPWNPAERLFIGDRLGTLVIEYADGSRDRVDLVYGRTAWWYANGTGMGATEPFASDAAARRVLEAALDLWPTGGADGHAYLLAVEPQAKPIRALRIADNPEKAGVPVVTAITVDATGPAESLGPVLPARPATAAEQAWLASHTVVAGRQPGKAEEQRLEALRQVLYTSPAIVAQAPPVERPAGFRGPTVQFAGPGGAPAILTGIYYHSLQDMDDKVDGDGTFHTSTKGAPSWGGYEGFGQWHPSYGAYYSHAWSRDLGRVLGELAEWGYESDAQACAKWCNEWLTWFPKQFPRIQAAGQPVPGHWVRIINLPEMVQTPGMPEKFGNLENDGHGLIMLFQYRAWLHAGRAADWVNERWEGVRTAAEWVCWQLDHPEISGSHDDVLSSDSEGGVGSSIYCDLPCLLGLRAYADMAETAGKRAEAARWRAYADRLAGGIGRYYAADDPRYGAVWHPHRAAVWPFQHGTLAAALIWPDYHGLDLSGMPADWLARSKNTLQRQLAACRPDHASGVAMGYGQGFITQAALLLDEMADGAACLERLAGLTYFPGHKPYIVPEGCEITPDGRWWHRTGDLGNAVQEGEALKAIRIVVGIDDTDPAATQVLPRLPAGWGLAVTDFPVMTRWAGQVVERRVRLEYGRQGKGYRLSLLADGPLDRLAVRLGPFPAGAKAVRAQVNGQARVLPVTRSGDSGWAWVRGMRGVTQVEVAAE